MSTLAKLLSSDELQNLKTLDLDFNEFLFLILLLRKKDSSFFQTYIKSLLTKGYIKPSEQKTPYELPIYLPTEEAIAKIINFILDLKLKESEKTITTDLKVLAKTLQELFPKGHKSPGHPWRSNTKEVEDKLKRFLAIYDYTNEQIIDATTLYVETMRDSPYMRTLKHFIIKKINGESISDLASTIENEKCPDYGSKYTVSFRPDDSTGIPTGRISQPSRRDTESSEFNFDDFSK